MRPRLRAHVRAAFVGASTVAVVVACYAPTEIVARYTTNVACTVVRASGVEIRAAKSTELLADAPPNATSYECSEGNGVNDLGSLVFLPRDDESDFLVEAVLGVDQPTSTCRSSTNGAGCIVVRQRLSYVRHRRLSVTVLLDRQCLGVRCKDGETCQRSVCVPDNVAACSGEDCTTGAPDPVGPGVPGVPGDGDGGRPLPLDGSVPLDGGEGAGTSCVDTTQCPNGLFCCCNECVRVSTCPPACP